MRENGAKDHRAEGRGGGNRHGGARAVDQAGQRIPAEAVGAQEMLRRAVRHPDGRRQDIEQVLVVRMVGGEPRRENTADKHQQGNKAAHQNIQIIKPGRLAHHLLLSFGFRRYAAASASELKISVVAQ